MYISAWGSNETRIWLNNLPEWTYSFDEVLEMTYTDIETGLKETRRAALERLVPKGGRAYYGGLSVSFVPQQSKTLSVQIPVTHGNGHPYLQSLASKVDTPHIGFPKEYAEGLFRGVMLSGKMQVLGSGILRLDGAVHGEVGSSVHFFQQTCQMLVRILISDMKVFLLEE